MKKIFNGLLIFLLVTLSVGLIGNLAKGFVDEKTNEEIKQNIVISVDDDDYSLIYGNELAKESKLNSIIQPGNYSYPWSLGISEGLLEDAPEDLNAVFSMRVYYSILGQEGELYTKYVTQEITDKLGNKWIRTTEDSGSTWNDWRSY